MIPTRMSRIQLHRGRPRPCSLVTSLVRNYCIEFWTEVNEQQSHVVVLPLQVAKGCAPCQSYDYQHMIIRWSRCFPGVDLLERSSQSTCARCQSFGSEIPHCPIAPLDLPDVFLKVISGLLVGHWITRVVRSSAFSQFGSNIPTDPWLLVGKNGWRFWMISSVHLLR